MKIPDQLADLGSTESVTKKPTKARSVAAKKARKPVRKAPTELMKTAAYSLEPRQIAHISSEAVRLGQEQGRPVNASEALRAILNRDMKRGNK